MEENWRFEEIPESDENKGPTAPLLETRQVGFGDNTLVLRSLSIETSRESGSLGYFPSTGLGITGKDDDITLETP